MQTYWNRGIMRCIGTIIQSINKHSTSMYTVDSIFHAIYTFLCGRADCTSIQMGRITSLNKHEVSLQQPIWSETHLYETTHPLKLLGSLLDPEISGSLTGGRSFFASLSSFLASIWKRNQIRNLSIKPWSFRLLHSKLHPQDLAPPSS